MRPHNAGVSGIATVAFIASLLAVLGALGAVPHSQQPSLMAAAEVGNVSTPSSLGTANSTAADAQCNPVNPKCGCGEIMQNGKCTKASMKQNMYMCQCTAQTPVGQVKGKCVAQNKCQATSLPGGKPPTTPPSGQPIASNNNGTASDAPQPGVPPSSGGGQAQTGGGTSQSGAGTTGGSGGGGGSSGSGSSGSGGGTSAGGSTGSSGGGGSSGASGGGSENSSLPPSSQPVQSNSSPGSNSFGGEPYPSSGQTAPTSGGGGAGSSGSFGSTGSGFSGFSGLSGGVTGLEPILAQNPAVPGQTYSSGYTGVNAYTPVSPTFMGSTGSQQSAPVVSADNSSLTNLVSSIGNVSLNQFFEYLGTLFETETPSSQSAAQNVSQSENDSNPQLLNSEQGASGTVVTNIYETPQTLEGAPPVSEDGLNPTQDEQSAAQGGQDQYESLAQLLTSGAPSITPGDILAILQSTNAAPATDTGVPTINLTPASSFEQQLLPSSSGSNATESNQTVPEQFYIEESDLAQEQSNYQWLLAQIQAWQNAQEAGVCDNTCSDALSLLQSEQPDQMQQVQKLQTLVNEGPAVFESSSSVPIESVVPNVTTQAPGAGLSAVISDQTSALQTPVPAEGAPYYTEENNEWCDQYGQCIPESAFETSPAQYVASQVNTTLATTSTMLPQNSGASLDPVTAIVRTLEGFVNNVISLFTPTSQSGTQSTSCSLFSSLFGGCEGY